MNVVGLAVAAARTAARAHAYVVALLCRRFNGIVKNSIQRMRISRRTYGALVAVDCPLRLFWDMVVPLLCWR